MADTFVFKGFLYDEDKILAKRNLEMGGAVQKFIDSEVLRLCEPLVPFDQGTLARRGNHWFDRMKQNGGKDEILAGARKLAGV